MADIKKIATRLVELWQMKFDIKTFSLSFDVNDFKFITTALKYIFDKPIYHNSTLLTGADNDTIITSLSSLSYPTHIFPDVVPDGYTLVSTYMDFGQVHTNFNGCNLKFDALTYGGITWNVAGNAYLATLSATGTNNSLVQSSSCGSVMSVGSSQDVELDFGTAPDSYTVTFTCRRTLEII